MQSTANARYCTLVHVFLNSILKARALYRLFSYNVYVNCVNSTFHHRITSNSGVNYLSMRDVVIKINLLRKVYPYIMCASGYRIEVREHTVSKATPFPPVCSASMHKTKVYRFNFRTYGFDCHLPSNLRLNDHFQPPARINFWAQG